MRSLLLTIAAGAMLCAQSGAPAPEKKTGITGAFEGWFKNPDGSFTLLLGYFNRSDKQEIDVPAVRPPRLDPVVRTDRHVDLLLIASIEIPQQQRKASVGILKPSFVSPRDAGLLFRILRQCNRASQCETREPHHFLCFAAHSA